jgi:glycolate oxidase FAD binding subunit
MDLGALSGIVDYVPGDLTLTALAGTPLAEIAAITAAERQWLALDPFGDDAGSLGATVATASAGPLAHAFGTPRDAVLGVEVVTGTGALVRGGGRVVKNVAGFDLTRLFTGAWGTLGAITELTVRLRARPDVDETFALPIPRDAELLDDLLGRTRRAAIAPMALELVSAPLAARLGVTSGSLLLARLGGNADAVRAQRAALDALGECQAVPAEVWSRLRAIEPAGAAVVRLSALPSLLPTLWSAALDAAALHDGVLVHATVGRGVVRCIAPTAPADGVARWLDALRRLDATRVVERLPAAAWGDLPSPLESPLMRDVKRAFDPMAILNPGIFGEAA